MMPMLVSALPLVDSVVPLATLMVPSLVGKLLTCRIPSFTFTAPLLLKGTLKICVAALPACLLMIPWLVNEPPLRSLIGAPPAPCKFTTPLDALANAPPKNHTSPPPVMFTVPLFVHGMIKSARLETVVTPLVVNVPPPARFDPGPLQLNAPFTTRLALTPSVVESSPASVSVLANVSGTLKLSDPAVTEVVPVVAMP